MSHIVAVDVDTIKNLNLLDTTAFLPSNRSDRFLMTGTKSNDRELEVECGRSVCQLEIHFGCGGKEHVL